MNSAELLDRIEEAAIDGEVVQALLLCQKLGGDADAVELSDWARHELEGYPLDASPPDYRRVRGTLRGDGAAPGQRVRAVAIPLEALPAAQQEEFSKGIPFWDSISEIAARSKRDVFGWTPAHMGKMLDWVNSSNASLVVFDMVYFELHGAAFEGVLAAVRSQIVGLVTKLRSSSATDNQFDPAVVQAAVSGLITGSVVNVTGDHNQVAVGAGGDIQQDAATEGRSKSGPMHRIWRWLKRILEAIAVFGAVVAFLGGGSINPF